MKDETRFGLHYRSNNLYSPPVASDRPHECRLGFGSQNHGSLQEPISTVLTCRLPHHYYTLVGLVLLWLYWGNGYAGSKPLVHHRLFSLLWSLWLPDWILLASQDRQYGTGYHSPDWRELIEDHVRCVPSRARVQVASCPAQVYCRSEPEPNDLRVCQLRTPW